MSPPAAYNKCSIIHALITEMVKSISPLVIKFLRLIGFFFKCFGPRLLRFLRLIKGIVLLPVNLRSLFDRKRIVAEPPPLSIYFFKFFK